jgi:rhodanese-related sulfurtransferase
VSDIDEISCEQAAARLDDFCVVDVRAEHEFHGPLGHIERALLLPLPELEARAGEIPLDRPLLMVCRSGMRSAIACEKVAAQGLGPSVNLAGGMIDWNRARLPIVPASPPTLGALLESVVGWAVHVGVLRSESAEGFVADGLLRHGASRQDPTRAAVEAVLEDLEASLEGARPPADLDLCMASFRRSLAML